MSNHGIKYLLFDVESVADGTLVSGVRYPGQDLSPDVAIAEYRHELMEKNGTDFIPYTFQIPVSVVVGKVSKEFELLDLVTLDDPDYRPHAITQKFWLGWKMYSQPTFVTFNGRTFDLPLMELAAFRYGISVPDWFAGDKSWEQPRNRYSMWSHIDLQEILTNYGASRFNGGLNLAAQMLGKPGKMDVQGDMVQDMYAQGRLQEVNDYCRCDVLDTYFIFLRCMVMIGKLDLDKEIELVNKTRQWLEERSDQFEIYAAYLERWSEWPNPWAAVESED